MIITTWNVRGFTAAKAEMAARLTRSADITCLTETWGKVQDTDDWSATNCLALTETGQPRRAGGVAVLHTDSMPFRYISSHSTKFFQLLHGTANGVPILACYISPQTPHDEFMRVLAIAKRCLQGPGILLGDFNARHSSWDSTTTPRGSRLHKWAQRHNFRTHKPPAPTFQSSRGTSRVDLIFHRSPTLPSITTLPQVLGSDHRPIVAKLQLSKPTNLTHIPLSLISNERCRQRARDKYKRSIPPILKSINQSNTPTSLEINCRRLAEAIVEPWAALCTPRSPRFRPGWTKALDDKARKRKRLLTSKRPEDKEAAARINKHIKRMFRRNKRNLKLQIADELENGNPAEDLRLLKRALAVDGLRDVAPVQVDPDKYTEFMAELQPPAESTTLVETLPFTVPDTFRASLLTAITQKLKPKRSPGPDLIPTEIFKVLPYIFIDAAMDIWRAIGRINRVPSLIHSALLSPIYKNSGDPSLPSNHRPISLTTSFRRLICTALTIEIRKHYRHSLKHQWGFQDGSNTDCAIAFAVNKLRHDLPYATLLDLRKAYDCVPRNTLQTIIDQRLPSGLSVMIRPLLWPMKLKTKYQRSTTCVKTIAGVPQGDATSPHLFNIFMDSFLSQVNVNPRQGIASLFVDDVLVLARNRECMQHTINSATSWSDEHRMTWTIEKSFSISLPFQVQLHNAPLTDAAEVTYLGVSLGPDGLTDDKLLQRIYKAQQILGKITRVTGRWNTYLRQRRMFVKTFVFSVTDYMLPLQPLTESVKKSAAELERKCLQFILGVPISTKQTKRATRLARMLPLESRRRRHTVKLVHKYYGNAISDKPTPRHVDNWANISRYATVASFIRQTKLPQDKEDLDEWKNLRLRSINANVWDEKDHHVRKIPAGQKLPHVYRDNVSAASERKATQWYMNRIPGSPLLSKLKPYLTNLLTKEEMTDDETIQLDHMLLQLRNQSRK